MGFTSGAFCWLLVFTTYAFSFAARHGWYKIEACSGPVPDIGMRAEP
jgi:hypothetical protein